jgi:hypothetical protein
MHVRPPILLAALLSLPAGAQTDALYDVERPAGAPPGWGAHLYALADLDGDGVGELGLGRRNHGAGVVAWVHSGADGAPLLEVSVPNVPLFFGQNLASVDDHDGDGVDDLVLFGGHSGASQSPDGWIEVVSGADGALLKHLTPPAGIVLGEGPTLALGDVDGDGHTDVLCRAIPVAAIGSPHVQLFSSATGDALYSGVVEDPVSSIGNQLVRLPDRDGDGVDDFAATGTDGTGSRVDIRSGRTGQVLTVLRGAGIGLLTNNLEPLVRTPDRDGDGLDDLAVGNFFELHGAGLLGGVRSFSSATGGLLNRWLPAPQTSILGFLMVAPGDLDLDGRDDLLAAQQRLDAAGHVIGTELLGLDLASTTPIFVELLPGLGGLHAANLVALPGVDPTGFAAFASFEGGDQVVRVRRYAPEVGTLYCASTPNSTGQAATIRALGSASLATDRFLLAARDLPPGKPGLFFYGPTATQVPFGLGLRCVGGGATGIARLPLEVADASGQISHRVDFSSPPGAASQITAGSTWHFQCWFRDRALAPGFQTSDAVSVTFLP